MHRQDTLYIFFLFYCFKKYNFIYLKDILKFICIFMIVFTGYLFGLNNLYYYYERTVKESVEIKPDMHPNLNDHSSHHEIHAGKRFGT